MDISKGLALLTVIVVIGGVLGAVSRLPAVLADSRALLVLGLIAAATAAVAGVTALSRRWRTNPYWEG
ncbi:MAG: hypothetical protein ABEI76_08500 [Halobacteriales archaeon]